MTVHSTTQHERKRCIVSKGMLALRQTHEDLNRFCRATELSYYYVRHWLPHGQYGPDCKAPIALDYLPALAWHKSRNEMPHYNYTLGGLMEDMDRAFAQVWSATIIYFCAAFDAYIGEWATFVFGKGKEPPWTDYMKRLENFADIMTSDYRPPLWLVMRVDLCRYMRNKLVHSPRRLPRDQNDEDIIVKWIAQTKNNAKRIAPHWDVSPADVGREIGDAVRKVVGRAGDVRAKAKELDPGKEAPPREYLYMLYVFANLNRLALRIDQILLSDEEIETSRAAYRSLRDRRDSEADREAWARLHKELWKSAINVDPREVFRGKMLEDMEAAWDHLREWPKVWAAGPAADSAEVWSRQSETSNEGEGTEGR